MSIGEAALTVLMRAWWRDDKQRWAVGPTGTGVLATRMIISDSAGGGGGGSERRSWSLKEMSVWSELLYSRSHRVMDGRKTHCRTRAPGEFCDHLSGSQSPVREGNLPREPRSNHPVLHTVHHLWPENLLTQQRPGLLLY